MSTTPWPWPLDSTTDRARRVALSYRRLMELALAGQIDDPATAFDNLDSKWLELGQHWIKPNEQPLNLDDWLTPGEMAALLCIDARALRDWARRGHLRIIHTSTGQRRYNVGDVVSYAQNRRQRRAKTLV